MNYYKVFNFLLEIFTKLLKSLPPRAPIIIMKERIARHARLNPPPPTGSLIHKDFTLFSVIDILKYYIMDAGISK